MTRSRKLFQNPISRARTAISSLILTACVCAGPWSFPCWARPQPGTGQDLPSALRKSVPDSVADLKAIEDHVEGLIRKVAPAVVAVRVGNSGGSGVVISEDGWV